MANNRGLRFHCPDALTPADWRRLEASDHTDNGGATAWFAPRNIPGHPLGGLPKPLMGSWCLHAQQHVPVRRFSLFLRQPSTRIDRFPDDVFLVGYGVGERV